jgi:Mn-dependent DtxR family transcriptional regulator
MLINLFEICCQHSDPQHLHSVNILKPMPDYNKATIKKLSEQGLITLTKQKEWCLTEKGIANARRIIKNGGLL